jgi:ATP-dependent protease Clp ATPase subunit
LKLISSPSDYPRAYICDECITVCASILDDGSDQPPAVSEPPVNAGEKHPLLTHPMTSSLLSAIEHWIRHESLGVDAAHELSKVRKIAVEMMMDPYPRE